MVAHRCAFEVLHAIYCVSRHHRRPIHLPHRFRCEKPKGRTIMNTAIEGIQNIVLVHGAFADGSGWRRVYDDLTARGFRVTIVQNPLTSLADDVAATTRALDRQ